MAKYIPLDALVAEIERRFDEYSSSILKHYDACKEAKAQELGKILTIIGTLEVKEIGVDFGDPKGDKSAKYIIDTKNLEVKEVANTHNIRFPHYKSIVEKVFGAGNLESLEYDEAERLVSLAKEELLKDLEVKEVDLEKEIQDHIKECLDIKFPTTDIELIKKDVAYTAKKFFELGLKAQKGE